MKTKMFQKLKKIFYLSALFLGLFFASSAFAAGDLLVQFESQPLFSDANFLPGNTVTRWVRVTNNTTETKYIATKAMNYSGDDLSRSLNITIKENGGVSLYSKTLLDFYNDGEIYLSNIGPGAFKEYDFEISFPGDAGNSWQGKTTGFDIGVGSQGQIQPQTYGSDSGGGSSGGVVNDEGIGGIGGGSEEGGGEVGGSGEENPIIGEVKGAYTERNNQSGRITQKASGEETSGEVAGENTEKAELTSSLAAAIGDALKGFKNFCWLLLIVIIILILLLLSLIKKNKFKENKAWWLVPVALVILLIIYYLYCPYAEFIIAGAIIAFIVSFSRSL
jgi:hypothetical protein